MSIESLLEDSVIDEFMRDPLLQTQTIRKHDYSGEIGGDDQALDAEVTSVIVVTATDRGEFKMGSGIRNLNVEVQIRVNGEADNFNGTLLDDLASAVEYRLTPTGNVSGALSEQRLAIFSGQNLRVFGITNGDITQRIESGLERIRIVPAGFIASKV